MALGDERGALGVVGPDLEDRDLGGGVDTRGVPVGLVLEVDFNVRVRCLLGKGLARRTGDSEEGGGRSAR